MKSKLSKKLSLRIRFHRRGIRNLPAHDIVVTKPRTRRDGRHLDRVGYKSPYSTPEIFYINLEKYIYWIQHGAKASVTVKKYILKSICSIK